ncbi:MAG: LPS-assembly protein LptD, partial [bacterium]
MKAVKAEWNNVTHRIVYHDATLEMFGVPVAYTPYFRQADPTVKHESGILTPELGHSSILGSILRVPVYVAFSDSEDLTAMPMLTTHAGQLLEGEYRKRWDDGGMWLQGSIAYDPNGGLSGHEHEWYGSIFGSGIIPFTNVWHFGYDAQYTSNDTYLKRYDLSTLDRLTNDMFIEGIDGRSRFVLTGYYFEGLRITDNQRSFPLVLPLIDYTFVPEHKVFGGDFRFDANSAVISRDLGPQSERVSAEVRWRLPILTSNGQMITVQADTRGDIYRVTNNDLVDFPNIPEKANYISRGLPYVAIDWRWPFVAGGQDTSYVLEPLVQAIAAPYG